MKNKILLILTLFSINFVLIEFSNAQDQFSFDVSEIEVLENGNKIIGSKRGKISTGDGIIIEADNFTYKKIENVLNANGNVIINDTINDYKIYSNNIRTFGSNTNSNYSYKLINLTNKKSSFNLYKAKKILSKNLSTNLLGRHNVHNITAALSIVDHLGYKIKKSHILNFKGTKRRMNIIGKLKKTLFIDDYAHHPTEIEKLIDISLLYKKKHIYIVLEPHRYTRLNDLYEEYLSVLKNIKNLIILKTYEAGENYKKGMKNSKNLVNDLNVLNNQKTKYISNYNDLFSLFDQFVLNKSESIIISAGAGDISNQIRFFYESRK